MNFKDLEIEHVEPDIPSADEIADKIMGMCNEGQLSPMPPEIYRYNSILSHYLHDILEAF